ncbi:MAG: tetratricopeptide repeat protein, partial [Muribaculum sp.]|nr:tetratricopeptide repeat protein [Muribaculum sp.]
MKIMIKRYIAAGTLLLALGTNVADAGSRVEMFLHRAGRMYSAGNYQATLDQLDYILDTQHSVMSPAEMSDACWLRAGALLRSGYIDEARRAYTLWLNDNGASPRRVACEVALADCDFFQGRYETAVVAYAAIRSGAVDPSLRGELDYRMAFCYLKLGQLDKAKAGFERLSAWRDYRSARNFYLGYIAYLEGDYAEARRLMALADPSTAPGCDARYYLIQMDYQQRNYSLAFDEAQTVIDAPSPYGAEMMRIAGESAWLTGRRDDAFGYLDRYMSMTDKPESSAKYILGIRAYENGEWRRTIELMTDAAATHDDAMGQSAYLYTGQALLREGDRDAALIAFDRAARMTFDSAVTETALYNYIATRQEGGRTPFGSTTALCEEFLAKYPKSKYASRVREYLVTGYMTDDNYEKALESLQNLRNPDKSLLAAKQQVLLTLGSRDVAAGQYSRALQRLSEARTLAGRDLGKVAQCDLWLGETKYRLADYKDAV